MESTRESHVKSKIFFLLKDCFQAERFEREINEMVSEVLNIILKIEMEDLIGVGEYERSKARMNCRNGYRTRTLRSLVGPVSVRIPRLRKGSFKTAVFKQFMENEIAVYQFLSGLCRNNVKRTQVKKLYTVMTRKDISKNALMSLMDSFEILSDRMECFEARADTVAGQLI